MDIIIPAIAGALGNLTSDTVKAGYRKLKELVLRRRAAGALEMLGAETGFNEQEARK